MIQFDHQTGRLPSFIRFAPQTLQGKLLLTFIVMLGYGAGFLFLPAIFGKGVVAPFSILPVVLIAWLLGLRGGLLMGLFSLPLNIFLFRLIGEPFVPGGGISGIVTGAVVRMLIGAVVGRLRDMGEETRAHLARRIQAEAALQQAYDDLEKVFAERTAESALNQTLRDSVAQFRHLFANNPHPMFVYDLHSLEFLEVNEAAVNLYGYSPDEFSTMGITDIRPPEDIPKLLKDVFGKKRESLEKSEGWRHRLKNGRVIDVAITSHTIQFAGRDAVLVVVQDITARKQAEENLQYRSRELAHSNQIITALGQVAARFNAIPDPDSVIKTMGGELKALKIESCVALLEPDGQGLVIHYVSRTREIPAQVQNLLAPPEPRFRLTPERFAPFNKIVREKQALFIPDMVSLVVDLLPNTMQEILTHVLELSNVFPDSHAIALPLIAKGHVFGVLGLWSTDLQESDIPAASIFASQVAIAFENARLYEQEQRYTAQLEQRVAERTANLAQQYRRQTAMATLKPAVSDWYELETLLGQIVEMSREHLPAGGSYIVLQDREVEGGAEDTADPHEQVPPAMKWDGELTQWIMKRGRPLVLSDIHHGPFGLDLAVATSHIRAYAGFPLMTGNGPMGVLYVFDRQPRIYTPEDVAFMTTLANRAALPIVKVHLYEQLHRANGELSRANRLKDEFLSSMSHELRTPLNTILGLSEALQEEVYGPMNERQCRSLQHIEESGRLLLTLINDILDISKIEAGKMELEIRPVSVRSICQTGLQFIKQVAHKKQIQVNTSIDSAVTAVQADERRLKQILVNLLSNAVKFTPEGGTVGLEVVGDAEHQMVHFIIWDTGIGIAARDMNRLFQPFVQLDASLSRHYSGTGLGLALVERMTHMHNGRVSVESEVGKGSRFTVSLPWQAANRYEA